MCYGIYDKKTHLLLERNLPQDTTFAIIEELMFGYPDNNGRFSIVKEVDEGWLCTESLRLVPVVDDTDAPVRMTRKKVYNERVVGKPGFWELTTYNRAGDVLRTAQYTDVMPEGYLGGLVDDYLRFPLTLAEEI